MDLMTVKDIAKKLQLSPRSIWRMVNTGKMPAPVRLIRSVRWKRSDIEQWIAFGCPDHKSHDAIKAD
jgi:excisionase family DNA binding protein